MRRFHLWLPVLIAVGVTACQDQPVPNPNPTPPPPTITPPSPPPPDVTTPSSLWSDAATWGGKLPDAGTAVTIPANQRVVLDSSVKVKSVTVLGTLEFADRDVSLEADFISVMGKLKIGDALKPFDKKATITLTGTDTENIMEMGSRGILVMGGRLELYGKAPAKVWTKLADHAAAGAGSLKLFEVAGWNAGDKLVIAPTDFYNDGNFMKTSVTESLEVAGVTGDTVNLKSPLTAARWGKLQYVTDAGMSLTPQTGFQTPVPNTPTTLDERAEVGNLTRHIVIQSADDALWKDKGFGAQVMVMNRTSSVTVDGVELRRVGQAGKFGRYPIHFHNLSYDSSGTELGDVNFKVQRSSIWDSSQRCLVIHGSTGITVKDNICFDIEGHAIFLEDAVERRNVLEGNLVLKVRNPAKPLLMHEDTSSGFWVVNPDNTLRGNAVGDISGHGYWLAFPKQTLGPNKNVKLLPSSLPFGVFEDNVAHSVGSDGVHIDSVPKDSTVGELEGNKYAPTNDGSAYNYQNGVRFKLSRVTVYKNGAYWGAGGGIWNRNTFPDFEEWVSSDQMWNWFAGAGDNGVIRRSVVIANSLNTPTPRHHKHPLSAFASYHSTFDITQNLIVGFGFTGTESFDSSRPNVSIGAFRTDDYYTIAVDKGLQRNPDNKLILSNPGRRVQPFTTQNWTLAGALWDAHGLWGPKGNYWVYDEPFFTSGSSCTAVAPAGKNGSSCAGPYYGVGDYLTDFDTNRYSFKAPIEVTRVNPDGSQVGVWRVGDGNTAPMLGNMRHFAALKGGRFVLRFPNPSGGYRLPTSFGSSFSNLLTSSDSALLGVAFGKTVSSAVIANGAETRTLTAGASIAAVEADSSGKTYYQDSGAQVVWVKLLGGMKPNPYWDKNPNSDDQMYQSMRLELK
jgi:G8 domain